MAFEEQNVTEKAHVSDQSGSRQAEGGMAALFWMQTEKGRESTEKTQSSSMAQERGQGAVESYRAELTAQGSHEARGGRKRKVRGWAATGGAVQWAARNTSNRATANRVSSCEN